MRDRLGANGSPEFALIWKARDMPSGPPICRLAASARRISGSDCSGWPTPVKADAERGSDAYARREGNPTLVGTARLSAWPTPNTPSGGRSISPEKMDATGRTADGRKHTASLEHAVRFAGWATPRTSDGEKNARSTAGAISEASRKGAQNDLGTTAALAGWATPTRTAAERRGQVSTTPKNATLNHMARWAGVAHFGPMPNGSPASTTGRGVLNPAFSLWLMGFRAVWQRSAPNWSDWRRWQDWIASLSPAQRPLASEDCAEPETP